MSDITYVGLGLLVLASSAAIDFAHTRYVQAVQACRRHRAAAWSVLQWTGGTIGFVVAVKVSFWLLPLEAIGLYLGTVLAIPRTPRIPMMKIVREHQR